MSSIDPLVWSVLLLLAGLGLTLLEVFVPSGGVLGFLALASLASSVIMAFSLRGMGAGLTIATLAVVAFPAVLALAFKLWPRTAMGRKFLLGLPTEEEVTPDSQHRQTLKSLVGRIGVAKTPMLPSGAIVIDNRTIDAVSQGIAIDPGQSVKVVEVKANRVVVRPAERDEVEEAKNSNDVLSQPLDKFGLEPFDDPLA